MAIKPIIHLNGSGKRHLEDSYSEAYRTLAEAYDKVQATRPHGRDYYPLGDEAFQQATKEHEARLERIAATLEEIREIVNGIA